MTAMQENGDLLGRVLRLYAIYARACDNSNELGLRDLMVEDVRLSRGDSTFEGIEAVLTEYRGGFSARLLSSHHLIVNVLADRGDDGVTRAQAYFTAVVTKPNRSWMYVGQYDDEIRDVEGALRFAHKRISVDTVLELPAPLADGPAVDAGGGRRSAERESGHGDA